MKVKTHSDAKLVTNLRVFLFKHCVEKFCLAELASKNFFNTFTKIELSLRDRPLSSSLLLEAAREPVGPGRAPFSGSAVLGD